MMAGRKQSCNVSGNKYTGSECVGIYGKGGGLKEYKKHTLIEKRY